MIAENPIRVRGIDHLVLRTTNVERLVAFYLDVIGCTVDRSAAGSSLTQLRAGVSLIDILEVGDDRASMSNGNMDHFCVAIEPWSSHRIVAHLRQHDVPFEGPVQRYGAGGTGPSIYIKDPDGNTVELKGPAATSAGTS